MILVSVLGILLQPALFQFNPPALRFTPAFTGNAPDYDEMQRLETLSTYFIHPAAQPAPSTASVLPAEPNEEQPPAAPYRMTLDGHLTRLAQVDNLQYADWQVAYLLGIESQGREWLVLYRGNVYGLSAGDHLQAEGLYVPEADGLHADQVRNLDARAVPAANLLWFERAAWLTAMFIIFTTAWVVWARAISPKKPKSPSGKPGKAAALVGSLLILALSFSACTLDITVLLRTDGSATMVVRMGDTRETMDFLRQVPGMAGYIQAALQDLRASGGLVDQSFTGDQEIFTLQRQLNSGDWVRGAFGPDSRSWISISTYEEGGQKVYRLLGVVDTSVLYQFDSNLDSQIRSGLSDTLRELNLHYNLVMPGTVTYHNASSQQGQSLTWNLRSNDTNQIIAEARIPLTELGSSPTSSEEFPPLWMWLALLGVFLLTLLIFILTIRSMRPTPSSKTEKQP